MVTTSATDSQGMLQATATLPEQVAAAADRAAGLKGLPAFEEVQSVVVLGMGGLEADVVMVEHWSDLPRGLASM